MTLGKMFSVLRRYLRIGAKPSSVAHIMPWMVHTNALYAVKLDGRKVFR